MAVSRWRWHLKNGEFLRSLLMAVLGIILHYPGSSPFEEIGYASYRSNRFFVGTEVGQFLDQAWTLIEADNGRNALALLEAITYSRLFDNRIIEKNSYPCYTTL